MVMASNNGGGKGGKGGEEEQRTAPMMSIHLHSELSASHASHGVVQGDYAQYAMYCTRRLSRLRHGKPVRRELLRCRMYKGAHSTRIVTVDGQEGGSSKARHAYRAIDMEGIPSEVLASSANYFLEPLYCAERCWAQSMDVKAEGGRGGGGGAGRGAAALGADSEREWSPGKVRGRSINRLRKAAKFATLLEALAASTRPLPAADGADAEDGGDDDDGRTEEEMARPPVDEHTRAEAGAYASWMRGNLALEQGRWQAACGEYQAALDLCESLAGSSEGGGDGGADDLRRLELFDFFTTRAQTVIAPLLRYCHYELQEKGMSPTEKISFLQSSSSVSDGPNDPLQSKLHSLRAQTLQSQATSGSSMSQIVFRENTIAVETKELRMALLKIQDLVADWEKDKEGSSGSAKNNAGSGGGGDDAKFMALLSGYDDAISLANQELRQLASLKSGPAVNAKRFGLVNVLGHCKYRKLRLVMGRNEGLADGIIGRNKKKGMTLKHLEEAAHLYDALLQDARDVAAIPGGGSPEDFDGVAYPSSPAPDVEDEFLLEANANVLRLRALRCYYLARMHASPLVRKYPEALALLDQAEGLAQEAAEEIGACDGMEGGDGYLEGLEGVLEEMRGEKCRVLAESFLGDGRGPTSGPRGTLLGRLCDYDAPSASAPGVACVPPELVPMPCKPSFFDVALNYVADYPVEELDRAIEEHSDRNDSAATTSKGFLGWFRR